MALRRYNSTIYYYYYHYHCHHDKYYQCY